MATIPKPAKRGPKPRKRIPRGKRPSRTRRRANAGALRELADDLMSLYVRHKNSWTCWVCSSRRHEEMQMAHLYPKGAHPCGRYMESNVRCLCSRCHTYYTHRDAEWARYLRNRLGTEHYETLGKMVDVRVGRQDYALQAFGWLKELEKRGDLWKAQERFEKLRARAIKLGVIPAPSEKTQPSGGSERLMTHH